MEPVAPLALIAVSLLIGMVIRRIPAFPENTHLALNQYLIYVALPSLALIHIPGMEIAADLLFPVATAWIVFFASMLLVRALSGRMGWDRKTAGCIILTAGLGNTAFVGFPVMEALYGPEGLQIALMVDQPGTFVVTSTLGVIVASIYATGKTRKRVVLRKVATFPPFIFFTAALLMNFVNVQPGGVVLGVLESFAATLTPIALISVGLQIRLGSTGGSILNPLSSALAYKLILAPLLLFVLYVMVLGGEGLAFDVSIMMAAMPPMVTGSILATSYGLNPRLASLIVGIGTPASILTLTGWYLFLGWMG
ncbi:AEC family transporter [Balneolales bacterium ANBcel1]|nr:AEC family transporter [Balneolales bacterium ANBcel1]